MRTRTAPGGPERPEAGGRRRGGSPGRRERHVVSCSLVTLSPQGLLFPAGMERRLHSAPVSRTGNTGLGRLFLLLCAADHFDQTSGILSLSSRGPVDRLLKKTGTDKVNPGRPHVTARTAFPGTERSLVAQGEETPFGIWKRSIFLRSGATRAGSLNPRRGRGSLCPASHARTARGTGRQGAGL